MFKDDVIITNIVSVVTVDSGKTHNFRNFSAKIPHNEIIVKLRGKSKIEFGEHTFIDEKGSVRFFAASKEKTVHYTAETLEPGKCIDIIFDTLEPVNETAFSVKFKNFEKISALSVKAESVWVKKQPGYKNTVFGYLNEVIGLIQSEAAYMPNSKLRKIEKGVNYITENYTDDIDIDNVAAVCGISHAYFKKIFKSFYGVTPKAYIIQLRMQYAIDLLASKQYKICEIAQMCGYENVYYFSRSFKNFTGVAPSEYLKNDLN